MDDGISFFGVLLIIAFALLQIILFFKIWGMTNDIKEIKNKIPNNDRIRDAELAYLSGNPGVAKKVLDEYFESIISDEKENSYSSEPKFRKERVLATYKYLGLDIPKEIG
ncbi:hypothetical protein [Parabacteroides gordonii]|uniref:hypothetical protein n=1 Tax=Parabacteroides gordonii TaxID=574930 RepID=UPI000ED6CF12|nr:hypothetical protein [Parabacteroides gordonii]RGP17253.1 hypothetical protein DXB27_07285 [Parabacteroides gordonii]